MSIVIHGVVEHGDARGHLLGFPTANPRMPGGAEYDGVWAARVVVPGLGSWHAAVSVGTRPTCYDSDSVRLAQAHLLDFPGDRYAHDTTVELIHLLREQVTCAWSSELVDLMRDDVRTRALLGPVATTPEDAEPSAAVSSRDLEAAPAATSH